MIDIFLTSFYRKEFTRKCVDLIHERTAPGSFNIHIYDNGSDFETKKFLMFLTVQMKISSLQLDSRNTGCLYNKLVFHAMTESQSKYYVVSDNDVYPPKLNPDWLSQMIAIMDAHPELAFLTPLVPPIFLQSPQEVKDDIVYCKAVGNTLKLVRREAINPNYFMQKLGAYGDDGLMSDVVHRNGWKVAFCRNIFCFHAGQCENWGYSKEQIDKDPRKSGYGKPFIYSPLNMETYEPPSNLRI